MSNWSVRYHTSRPAPLIGAVRKICPHATCENGQCQRMGRYGWALASSESPPPDPFYLLTPRSPDTARKELYVCTWVGVYTMVSQSICVPRKDAQPRESSRRPFLLFPFPPMWSLFPRPSLQHRHAIERPLSYTYTDISDNTYLLSSVDHPSSRETSTRYISRTT